MPVPFIMPKVDMDQEKATIISWSKQDGDPVKQDETVLVVETEKVSIDVPAPATGILVNIRYRAGDVVPIAQVIAYILKEGETLSDLPTDTTPAEVPAQREAAIVKPIENSAAVLPATPIAARIAREHSLDLRQVSAIGERIKREDVERFLESQKQVRTEKELPFSEKLAATPAARRLAREKGIRLESLSGSGRDGRIQAEDVKSVQRFESVTTREHKAEIIPLVGMRQKIASRMQASFQEAPHITLSVEADVTRLEAIRQHMNVLAVREQSAKISLTALLVKVSAWALVRNPYVNASLIEDHIYLWRDVNIGVATALEDGLIVPVIQQADQLSVRQVGDSLTDLSTRARENRLTLPDVQRGTFTISNLGMFGIRQFRAIINPPESAILAIGAVVRKPVVIDEQDTVAVRPIMVITISADHRVIDGVIAARFLADIVEGIEFPETLLY